MKTTRRPGFVASPRIVFPLLLIVVLGMYFIFASLDGQDVSEEHIIAAAVVGAGILTLLGVLVVLSRVRSTET